MTGDVDIVVCGVCGTKNRLKANWVGTPRCGNCKTLLPVAARPVPAAPEPAPPEPAPGRQPSAASVDSSRKPQSGSRRPYLIATILIVAMTGLGMAAYYMGFKRMPVADTPELAEIPEVFSTYPPEDCRQTVDHPLTIAGCTFLITREEVIPGTIDAATFADAYLFRGRAYVNLMHLAEARADYDRSILVLPVNPFAMEARGYLSEYEGRYEDAQADFETALAHAITFYGPTPTQDALNWQEVLQQSATRLRERVDLEIRWRSYLASIQDQDDYANWSGPPSDLYWRHHDQP